MTEISITFMRHGRSRADDEQVAGQYLVVAHGGILNAALRGIVGAQPNVDGRGIWFALGDTGYARAAYIPPTPPTSTSPSSPSPPPPSPNLPECTRP